MAGLWLEVMAIESEVIQSGFCFKCVCAQVKTGRVGMCVFVRVATTLERSDVSVLLIVGFREASLLASGINQLKPQMFCSTHDPFKKGSAMFLKQMSSVSRLPDSVSNVALETLKAEGK